jgi:hypothetical protein
MLWGRLHASHWDEVELTLLHNKVSAAWRLTVEATSYNTRFSMPSAPLRSSEDTPGPTLSSIIDIDTISALNNETAPLHLNDDTTNWARLSINSPSPRSIGSLDIEDPLGGVYVRNDDFEALSGGEVAFIGTACFGVVAVPLLYLLVSHLGVLGPSEVMLTLELSKSGWVFGYILDWEI